MRNVRVVLQRHCSENLQLGLFLCILMLSGCHERADYSDQTFEGRGRVRLARADQEQMDFCYLLVRTDLTDRLELSAVQRVKLGIYGNRLRHILNYYNKHPTSPAVVTDKLNDPTAKLSRTLELAESIKDSLDPNQIADFHQSVGRMELLPIEPVIGDKQLILKYTLKGDEPAREIIGEDGEKFLTVLMPTGDTAQWAQWLTSVAEIDEALRCNEYEVRQVGLERLRSFPTQQLTADERNQICDTLLWVKGLPETATRHRTDVILFLSQIATPAHQQSLIDLSEDAEGRQLKSLIAGLIRLASEQQDTTKVSQIADALLRLTESPHASKILRGEIMIAFSELVTPAHKQVLVDLTMSKDGKELEGAIAGLFRISRNDAITQTVSRANEFSPFSRCLDGLKRHGKDAEQSLIVLNDRLQGEQRMWIQNALRDIGSTHQIPKSRPSLRRPTSGQASKSSTGNKNPAPELKRTRSRATSLISTISDVEDWLAAFQNQQPSVHHMALNQSPQFESQLRRLPTRKQREIARICVDHMKAESSVFTAKKYGELLLETCGRDSVSQLKTLCSSSNRTSRVYGLAGLMRFSKTESVRTIVQYEKVSFGMHDVVKAAELAGKEAVKSLEAAYPKLEKRISQMSVQRVIDDLR